MSTEQVARLLDSAVDQVAHLDARFLVAALVLQLVALCCKIVAWRNVLAAAFPERRVPFHSVGCSYAAGMGLNAFLPARGGDAVKVALVRAQIEGSEIPAIVTTLGVVALFDAVIGGALVLALWASGTLPALPVPSPGLSLPLVAGLLVAAGGVAIAARLRPDAVKRTLEKAAHGVAVLRTPRRYLHQVMPFQLGAWLARIAVVYLVLASFHIDASPTTAALLVVLGGVSAAVPVPGGAGAQQVLATYALQGIASAATAISFSVGFQVGITAVNTAVGIAGAMLLFRTTRPLAAIRGAVGTRPTRGL